MSGNGVKAWETRRRGEHIDRMNQDALRYLAKATAAMTDPGAENAGLALYYASRALLSIAEADVTLAARDVALRVVRSQAGVEDCPGPYSGT